MARGSLCAPRGGPPSLTWILDEAPSGRSQTHALVVGVGAYPHLTGSAAVADRPLRQLPFAPAGARAFASWLLATPLSVPSAPLASLALLTSDVDGPATFTDPRDGTAHAVGVPDMAALTDAIREWRRRADRHPENVALFYFCGHALGSPGEAALLASDYGAPAPPTRAIDLGALLAAMEHVGARRQCWFLDVSWSRPLGGLDDMGDRHVLGAVAAHGPRSSNVAVYWASGAEPWDARAAPTTRFTDALLRALNGAGSRHAGAGWSVSTHTLAEGIAVAMERELHIGDVPHQEAAACTGAEFDLHVLGRPPVVPVAVTCALPAACRGAELIVTSPDGRARPAMPSDDGEWVIDLECATEAYAFEVRAGAVRGSAAVRVQPPGRDVRIELRG